MSSISLLINRHGCSCCFFCQYFSSGIKREYEVDVLRFLEPFCVTEASMIMWNYDSAYCRSLMFCSVSPSPSTICWERHYLLLMYIKLIIEIMRNLLKHPRFKFWSTKCTKGVFCPAFIREICEIFLVKDATPYIYSRSVRSTNIITWEWKQASPKPAER